MKYNEVKKETIVIDLLDRIKSETDHKTRFELIQQFAMFVSAIRTLEEVDKIKSVN